MEPARTTDNRIQDAQKDEPQSDACPALTPEQRAQLQDEATQEANLKAYREQMRRLNCPGCGETDIF